MSKIEPFHLAVPEAGLEDIRRRLESTRWPDAETVDDWSQGAPLANVQALCAYWRTGYDWRRCEAALNDLGQFRTEIDGLDIHFLHIPSRHAGAMPLIMTHGWPGSVIEFHKVIGPLTDPEAHGGVAADAFHLVLPSLPGYGFSGKPKQPGWGIERTAAAWVMLMARLGYDRFVAQGGDWGAAVTSRIGALRPPGCVGVHLNLVIANPTAEDLANPTPAEAEAVAEFKRFRATGSGYSEQQRTRPQTLGYGLTDSPAGQAAWIYEKLAAWSDCDGDPLRIFTMDEMLDNIMLYWLPATATSSARLYWESMGRARLTTDIPTGCSIFPKELSRTSRRWAERTYSNIVYWNEPDRGGHFAAFEQPALFVEELRAWRRALG